MVQCFWKGEQYPASQDRRRLRRTCPQSPDAAARETLRDDVLTSRAASPSLNAVDDSLQVTSAHISGCPMGTLCDSTLRRRLKAAGLAAFCAARIDKTSKPA